MDPIIVRGKELAKLLSVSLVHLRRLDSGGKLPKPLRLGHCVGWSLPEVQSWIEAGTPTRERWIAIQAASKKAVRNV